MRPVLGRRDVVVRRPVPSSAASLLGPYRTHLPGRGTDTCPTGGRCNRRPWVGVGRGGRRGLGDTDPGCCPRAVGRLHIVYGGLGGESDGRRQACGLVAFLYERQASDGGSGGLCVMRAGAAQATVPRQSGPRRWRCHAGEENRATEAGRVAVHTAYADPAAARRGPEGYIHRPASGPPRSAGARERGFAASAGLEPHPSVARTTCSPGGGGGGDGG